MPQGAPGADDDDGVRRPGSIPGVVSKAEGGYRRSQDDVATTSSAPKQWKITAVLPPQGSRGALESQRRLGFLVLSGPSHPHGLEAAASIWTHSEGGCCSETQPASTRRCCSHVPQSSRGAAPTTWSRAGVPWARAVPGEHAAAQGSASHPEHCCAKGASARAAAPPRRGPSASHGQGEAVVKGCEHRITAPRPARGRPGRHLLPVPLVQISGCAPASRDAKQQKCWLCNGSAACPEQTLVPEERQG